LTDKEQDEKPRYIEDDSTENEIDVQAMIAIRSTYHMVETLNGQKEKTGS